MALSLVWLPADRVRAATWIFPSGGYWSDSGKWSGGSVPGFADNVNLGADAAVKNSLVRLDQPAFANQLTVEDGMRISNRDNVTDDTVPLTVAGRTIIQGKNQSGIVHYYATIGLYRSPAAYDFSTDDLDIKEGGRLYLNEGAIAVVQDTLTTLGPGNGDPEGYITGDGVINLGGLNNNGEIDPRGDLTFNHTGNGLYNLDGTGNNGRVLVSGYEAFSSPDNLTFNGVGLTDSFSGEISLINGHRLNMNLSDGWEADAGSEIIVEASLAPDFARITGGDFTLGGDLQLLDEPDSREARLRITADTTVTPTADVQLGEDARLHFSGEATVMGGQFNVGQGGHLAFYDDTTVAGGEFTTATDIGTDGVVYFHGDTEYRGVVTFNGVASQGGDATVTQPTVINADRFNMQLFFDQVWSINSVLTVNAENIDFGSGNILAGTTNVGGNFLGKLTINLADPNDKWRMDGALNLNNLLPFGATRLAGSEVAIRGDLGVNGRGIGVEADATLAATSETTFVTEDSSLVMQQRTRVEAGATFVGDGLLVNHTTGHMTLDDGVSTDDVGLRNRGLLDIADRAGIAAVDRFENTADGVLAIDVGGHLLGDEFDHLQVAGEAILDGVLAVDLLFDDFENPVFLPAVGDEFMILTSLGGVSGQFAEVLPTYAGGAILGWEVLYHPHDVTIRLATVGVAVPEPAAWGLLTTAAAAFTGLRRRVR